MKYLSAEQLDALDAYWKKWATEQPSSKQKRMRLRLYLVYLLIRYGGLRLTEAIAFDDNRDFSFSSSTIRIPQSREIKVHEQPMAEILRTVEAQEVSGLHGSLTKIDPGCVRKNFYAIAQACGLPREMGGPRVLRHSRGAELFEQGASVSSVQHYLGLQSPVQAVELKKIQDDEAKQILCAHLRRESLRQSSARNSFAGNIVDFFEGNNLVSITIESVSGLRIQAVMAKESVRLLNLRQGQTLIASVKSPWVVLTAPNTQTSYSNNFQAKILFIKKGSLEASVRLRLDDGTGMNALMTLQSLEALGIKEGEFCTASFAATSVLLALG